MISSRDLIFKVAKDFNLEQYSIESYESFVFRVLYSLIGQKCYSLTMYGSYDNKDATSTVTKVRAHSDMVAFVEALQKLYPFYFQDRSGDNINIRKLILSIYQLYKKCGVAYNKKGAYLSCFYTTGKGQNLTFIRGSCLFTDVAISGLGLFTMLSFDKSLDVFDMFNLRKIKYIKHFHKRQQDKEKIRVNLVDTRQQNIYSNINCTDSSQQSTTLIAQDSVFTLEGAPPYTGDGGFASVMDYRERFIKPDAYNIYYFEGQSTVKTYVDERFFKIRPFTVAQLNFYKLYSFPQSFSELKRFEVRIFDKDVFNEMVYIFDKLGFSFIKLG